MQNPKDSNNIGHSHDDKSIPGAHHIQTHDHRSVVTEEDFLNNSHPSHDSSTGSLPEFRPSRGGLTSSADFHLETLQEITAVPVDATEEDKRIKKLQDMEDQLTQKLQDLETPIIATALPEDEILEPPKRRRQGILVCCAAVMLFIVVGGVAGGILANQRNNDSSTNSNFNQVSAPETAVPSSVEPRGQPTVSPTIPATDAPTLKSLSTNPTSPPTPSPSLKPTPIPTNFPTPGGLVNGEVCFFDSECQSNRCSYPGLRCEDKGSNGEPCFENEDCASGQCSVFFCT